MTVIVVPNWFMFVITSWAVLAAIEEAKNIYKRIIEKRLEKMN